MECHKEKYMSVSDAVKKIRYILCMDQQEFAEYMKISKSSICHYEQGNRVPRMPVIRRFISEAKKHNLTLELKDFVSDKSK